MAFVLYLMASFLHAEILPEGEIAEIITPPYSLGTPTEIEGVWELLNGAGLKDGYVIQTEQILPLPGFSGAAINMLVVMDLEGVLSDVRIINHNEPIFVSGLGEAPFNAFVEQYRGQSITNSLVVGNAYGDGNSASALVYLDGVTKATASVRIAHETILGAARDVAKKKLNGLVAAGSTATPILDYKEDLTWEKLVEEGIARNLKVSNGEVNKAFEGTLWADDDPKANETPNDTYLDFWLVDISPPSIAQVVLGKKGLEDLNDLGDIAIHDEFFLVVETARHGLVSEDFIRNTSPDWLTASQADLPIALRDSDLTIDIAPEVPQGQAMILRTDRRLGFSPIEPWVFEILAVREHGSFQPEIGSVIFSVEYQGADRFYEITREVQARPQWLEAIMGRINHIVILMGMLVIAFAVMIWQKTISAWKFYNSFRLSYLAVVLVFIGWIGQGQLSIVTALASLNTLISGKSFAFLLYDPFSLLIWGAAIIGFVFWGRGLFCGWLCPFGAFQDLVASVAKFLKIPQVNFPSAIENRALYIKYIALFSLILVTIIRPENMDKAAEIEPFKTAISVIFQREWIYVGYALICLLVSAISYKAFCRFLCPLGALMAIGGLLRGRDWIERRNECGSPCQLCKVKCAYGAIDKKGKIAYSECFGCLDCVTIFQRDDLCVPLIVAKKKAQK